jgi:hypothetical protein
MDSTVSAGFGLGARAGVVRGAAVPSAVVCGVVVRAAVVVRAVVVRGEVLREVVLRGVVARAGVLRAADLPVDPLALAGVARPADFDGVAALDAAGFAGVARFTGVLGTEFASGEESTCQPYQAILSVPC